MSTEGSESQKIDVAEKVANLPLSPGVYIYRDKNGSVLYVGKKL